MLSDAFPANARAQAAQLGLLAAPAVFVAHPISDQTEAQLLARAEAIGAVGASVLRHKSFRLDSAEDIDPYGGRASIAR